MNVLSVFITSNRLYFLLSLGNSIRNFTFSFFPYFQGQKDLDFLVEKFIQSTNLQTNDLKVEVITTIYDLQVLGKKAKFLNNEISKLDFTYIYFDNLTFYSHKNISCLTLGISIRSDNFISNRGVYSTTEFTGDSEEIIFMSKAIRETYSPKTKKVVFAGDYFTNSDIPNEYKVNLMAELLSSGFYELYVDKNNSLPNLLNLNESGVFDPSILDLEKFIYLISTEKDVQALIEYQGKSKYINTNYGETFFLHFMEEPNMTGKFKGRDIGKVEEIMDTEFPGMFIDRRKFEDKKDNFGIDNFRKVLNSIEKSHDYSSL